MKYKQQHKKTFTLRDRMMQSLPTNFYDVLAGIVILASLVWSIKNNNSSILPEILTFLVAAIGARTPVAKEVATALLQKVRIEPENKRTSNEDVNSS